MMRISRRQFVHRTSAAGTALLGGLWSRPVAAAISRRPFGKAGAEVTVVGMGGGGRFFEPVPSDEAAAEFVRRAIERGVGVIETAANYGPRGDTDRSERRIGLAMKTHRHRVFLETKIDARDYDGAMREMERSVRLLQTDQLDLVLHHAFFREDEVVIALGPNGAERAIRRMVDEKVVRFRGFSCHSPALTVATIPRIEPDAIQLPLNATRVPDFEPEVLPLAREHRIAVIAMKVCGHGFFRKDAIGGAYDSRFATDKNPERHRFAPPAEAFDRPHPSPTEFLHYALSLPISCAVIGTDSIATLESYAAAAERFKPLGDNERRSIHQRAQVFASTGYWIPMPRG
jgi:aryl-alcohol dehydrogenase-like predicted oxidoreductase